MAEKYECILLRSDCGIEAEVCTFGARLKRLLVPDTDGKKRDVILGFDASEEYENDHGTYFGATVGRVANRIGGGHFTLEGKEYFLAKNDNGVNHLHGGNVGFDKRVWNVEKLSESAARFTYVSEDGEEGYPGKLAVSVTFSLEGRALQIEYRAKSDITTLCALTNHAYFNLDGDGGSACEHEIFIDADSMTIVDDELIPTGERLDLTKPENAAFGFLKPHTLGEYLDKGGELMEIANGGYDFSYNFAGGADESKPRATAYSRKSGIKMSVYTDLPSMQFYTGNFLDGFKGKAGQAYQKHAAFCMETQCDIADISQRTLKAGEEYNTRTRYEFDLL